MGQRLPEESPAKAIERDPLSVRFARRGAEGNALAPLALADVPPEKLPDSLAMARAHAVRQSVNGLVGFLAITGLVLAAGALGAAPKYQATLGLAFLAVCADAVVLRMSVRPRSGAAKKYDAGIVAYVVIDLLLVMGIVAWASQMSPTTGWNFPPEIGPHIPTLLGVGAVIVAALTRSAGAIWCTALGASVVHLLAHLLVNDGVRSWAEMLQPHSRDLMFARWHLLYAFVIVGGVAVIARRLLQRSS